MPRCRSWMMFFLVVLPLVSVLSLPSLIVRPSYALEVNGALTEWIIPTANSDPTGLALDPLGKCCWFVESLGNKIGHLDPSSHTLREWAIPTPDSGATSLAVTTMSGSLIVFGTESGKNKVFLFFPDTGRFREYTLPTNSGPQYVSVETDGTKIRAWFSYQKRNAIGQIVYDSASGTAKLYEIVLPPAAGGGANDVYAGSGVVWLAGKAAIVKYDRMTSRFTAWTIPHHPSTQAVHLDLDALSQVWYTSGRETVANYYIGVLRENNTFTEWQVPNISADVRAISINPVTDNPWVTEHGLDKVVKLDPSTGGIVTSARPTGMTSTPENGALFTHVAGPVLPSTFTVSPTARAITGLATDEFTEWELAGGGNPSDLVVDASGKVWMLEPSTNKIARLSLAPDFAIECDPSSLIVVQGTDEVSTCAVTSFDGFSSGVELMGSWLGYEPSGISYSLSSHVTPPPGRAAFSTLIVSAGATASPGTYTFHISATSGTLSHGVDLLITVAAGAADFVLTVSPSYLTISPGASGSSIVTVQSVGVFFSPVQLGASEVPDGMRLDFRTNPVTPPIGGIGSSALDVIVSGAPTGTYTIAITGTSGSLVRNTELTVQVAGGCLIATATYGSELSDEVQLLRNFRDNSILKTSAGTNFMVVFNAWYYSFSPSVAQVVREQPIVRMGVRLGLYPLIGILRIGEVTFSVLPANSETSAVICGIVVSSLIGAVYLSAPLTGILVCSSRMQKRVNRVLLPAMVALFAAQIVSALIANLAPSAIPMTVATSTLVLASLAASALLASQAILRLTKHK